MNDIDSLQDLPQNVLACFEAEGVLAQTIEAFQPRQGQTDMALAVSEVLQQGGALVVEAGTGVGKTFAYLVPALLSGERVLLSTATKEGNAIISATMMICAKTNGIAPQ